MPRKARKAVIDAVARSPRALAWEEEATDVVLEVLRSESMRLPELASAMGEEESSVHHVLRRLERRRLVESVRGYWVAVDEPETWRHRR